MNAAAVFACVQTHASGITRREIAEQTGMSWGAVSAFTAALIENGYIMEEKAEISMSRGPIPSYLYVRGDVHVSLGLEINDMGLRASAVNLKHEIVESFSSPLTYSDREQLFADIYAFLDHVVHKVRKDRNILCIGVAMQGIVDSESGISLYIPGRIPDWRDVPIADLIASHTGIPTYIAHDPDCILYAAKADGYGADEILIRVDRGVGMAVMMDGTLLERPGIFELGHMTVEPNGILCGCGKQGCLDKYVSVRGIAARAKKSYAEACAEAHAGEKKALSLFADAGKYLAMGICSVSHLLAIPHVLLCGAFIEERSLFYSSFLEALAVYDPAHKIQIELMHTISAPRGAAMLAERRALAQINLEKT